MQVISPQSRLRVVGTSVNSVAMKFHETMDIDIIALKIVTLRCQSEGDSSGIRFYKETIINVRSATSMAVRSIILCRLLKVVARVDSII